MPWASRLRNITISNTVTSAVLLEQLLQRGDGMGDVGAANIGFVLDAGSQLSVKRGLVFNSNYGVVVRELGFGHQYGLPGRWTTMCSGTWRMRPSG